MDTLTEKQSLRIVVADDDVASRHLYGHFLRLLGHEVVASAEDGTELSALSEALQPDLVITDINMPARDGISASNQIWRSRPLPILLVSAAYDAHLLEKAPIDHVMAYLTKPIALQDLADGIALALRRFEQFEQVRAQSHSSINSAADWKVVCHAKQLLKKATHTSEEAAFERLVELAKAGQQGVAQAAQAVVSAYNLTEK